MSMNACPGLHRISDRLFKINKNLSDSWTPTSPHFLSPKGRFLSQPNIPIWKPTQECRSFGKLIPISKYNSLNHRMVWKGPIKVIESNSPSMSRNIFNEFRLLRALTNLIWNGSGHGDPAPPLATSSAVPSLSSCFLSQLKWPYFSLKQLLLIHSLQIL